MKDRILKNLFMLAILLPAFLVFNLNLENWWLNVIGLGYIFFLARLCKMGNADV